MAFLRMLFRDVEHSPTPGTLELFVSPPERVATGHGVSSRHKTSLFSAQKTPNLQMQSRKTVDSDHQNPEKHIYIYIDIYRFFRN